jgi:hypothetical protein
MLIFVLLQVKLPMRLMLLFPEMVPLEWISCIGSDDCKAAILSPFALDYVHLFVPDFFLFEPLVPSDLSPYLFVVL